MVRRTIKPFTVEVRGSRRKPQADGFDGPEQPRVVWPEALLQGVNQDAEKPFEAPAASKPMGRILPDLAEPSRPASNPAIAEPDVGPIEEVAEHEDAQPDVEAPPAPTEKEPRQRRPREPRASLARGERWKARLPAVIHRAGRKLRDRARELQ